MYIDEKINWQTAFLIGWSLGIILNLILYFQTPQDFEFYGNSVFIQLLFSSLIIPIGTFFLIGFSHLMLKLFGGKGKFSDTLKFSFMIGVFGTIINIFYNILLILLPNMRNGISIIYILFAFVFMFWSLAVYLKIFSVIHQIGQWRVFFALISPILIILIVIFISSLVLFQTAETLQSESLNVSIQSQEKITTDIEVVQVYANDASDGKINGAGVDNITLLVRLGLGSSPIKLEDLIVKMDIQAGSQTLSYGTVANETNYAVSYVKGGTDSPGYLITGDIAELRFSNANDVSGSESATIRLLTKNGAVKPVDLTTPPSMDKYTEYLFP